MSSPARGADSQRLDASAVGGVISRRQRRPAQQPREHTPPPSATAAAAADVSSAHGEATVKDGRGEEKRHGRRGLQWRRLGRGSRALVVVLVAAVAAGMVAVFYTVIMSESSVLSSVLSAVTAAQEPTPSEPVGFFSHSAAEWTALCSDASLAPALNVRWARAQDESTSTRDVMRVSQALCARYTDRVVQFLQPPPPASTRLEVLQRSLAAQPSSAGPVGSTAAPSAHTQVLSYQQHFLQLLLRGAGVDLANALFDPDGLLDSAADWSERLARLQGQRAADDSSTTRDASAPRTTVWDTLKRQRWSSGLSQPPPAILGYLENFTTAADVLYEGKRLLSVGLGKMYVDAEMVALHSMVFAAREGPHQETLLAGQTAWESALSSVFRGYAGQLRLVLELARLLTEVEKQRSSYSVAQGMTPPALVTPPPWDTQGARPRWVQAAAQPPRCILLRSYLRVLDRFPDRNDTTPRQQPVDPTLERLHGGRRHNLLPSLHFNVPFEVYVRLMADLRFAEVTREDFRAKAAAALTDFLTQKLLRSEDELAEGQEPPDGQPPHGSPRLAFARCTEGQTRRVAEAVARTRMSDAWLPQNWAYWMEPSSLQPTAFVTPVTSCSSLSRGDEDTEGSRYVCNLEYLLYAASNVSSWFSGNLQDLYVSAAEALREKEGGGPARAASTAAAAAFTGHRVLSIGSENRFLWEANLLAHFNLYHAPSVLQHTPQPSTGAPAHSIRAIAAFDCTVKEWHPWSVLYRDGALSRTGYAGRPLQPAELLHNVSMALFPVCLSGSSAVFNVSAAVNPTRLIVGIADLKQYIHGACEGPGNEKIAVVDTQTSPLHTTVDLGGVGPPFYLGEGTQRSIVAGQHGGCGDVGAVPWPPPRTASLSTHDTDDDTRAAITSATAFDEVAILKIDIEKDEYATIDSWNVHELLALYNGDQRFRAAVNRFRARQNHGQLAASRRASNAMTYPAVDVRAAMETSFYSVSLAMQEIHRLGDYLSVIELVHLLSHEPDDAFRTLRSRKSRFTALYHHFTVMASLGYVSLTTEMNPLGIVCCAEVTHAHYRYYMRSEVWMALKRANDRAVVRNAVIPGQQTAREPAAPHVAQRTLEPAVSRMKAYERFVLDLAAATVGPLWVDALYDAESAQAFFSRATEAIYAAEAPADEGAPRAARLLLCARRYFSAAMWWVLHDEELARLFARVGLWDNTPGGSGGDGVVDDWQMADATAADGSAPSPHSPRTPPAQRLQRERVRAAQRDGFVGALEGLIRGYATAARGVLQLAHERPPDATALNASHRFAQCVPPVGEGAEVDTSTSPDDSTPAVYVQPLSLAHPWGLAAADSFGDAVVRVLVSIRAHDTQASVVEALTTSMPSASPCELAAKGVCRRDDATSSDGPQWVCAGDAVRGALRCADSLAHRRWWVHQHGGLHPLRLLVDASAKGAFEGVKAGATAPTLATYFMRLLQCREYTPLGETGTLCNAPYLLSAPASVVDWNGDFSPVDAPLPDTQRTPARGAGEEEAAAALCGAVRESGRASFPHAMIALRARGGAAAMYSVHPLVRLFASEPTTTATTSARGDGTRPVKNALGFAEEQEISGRLSEPGPFFISNGTDGVSVLRSLLSSPGAGRRVRVHAGKLHRDTVDCAFDPITLLHIGSGVNPRKLANEWLNVEARRVRQQCFSPTARSAHQPTGNASAQRAASDCASDAAPRASHITWYAQAYVRYPQELLRDIMPFYALGYLPTGASQTGDRTERVDLVHYRYFVKSEMWARIHDSAP